MTEDIIRPWANPRGICGGRWHWSVSIIPPTLHTYLVFMFLFSGQVEEAWQPLSKVILFRKKIVVPLRSLLYVYVSLSFSFCLFITFFLYLSLL